MLGFNSASQSGYLPGGKQPLAPLVLTPRCNVTLAATEEQWHASLPCHFIVLCAFLIMQ